MWRQGQVQRSSWWAHVPIQDGPFRGFPCLNRRVLSPLDSPYAHPHIVAAHDGTVPGPGITVQLRQGFCQACPQWIQMYVWGALGDSNSSRGAVALEGGKQGGQRRS
jgi:hypothetical protein